MDHTHSLNAKGAYIHLLADAGGSVAAIIAGSLIVVTGNEIIDVIFAVLIALIILYSTIELLRQTTHILLQGVPDSVSINEFENRLQDIDGVIDVHHTHLWQINSSKIAGSSHIVISEQKNETQVLSEAIATAKELGINHPTIQIEKDSFTEKTSSCYVNQ